MNKKSGVSIIILVITIIVLIILSSTILIPAFKEGGIFNKAKLSAVANDDALVTEKIAKMNLESIRNRGPFNAKTIKLLKAITEQSDVDIENLGVYLNKENPEIQLVTYDLHKLQKKDIAWFLTHTVTVEVDGNEYNCKVYPLFGDVNFDMDIDNEDVDIVRSYNAGLSGQITREQALLLLDLTGDGNISSSDVTEVRNMTAGLIYVNDGNMMISFGSDTRVSYEDINKRIADYVGLDWDEIKNTIE